MGKKEYYGVFDAPISFKEEDPVVREERQLKEMRANRGGDTLLGKLEEAKRDLLRAVKLDPAVEPILRKISDRFKLDLP